MSDDRRIYNTIRNAVRQLCPSEPKGNLARRLNTMAGLAAGIAQAQSCQLPAIARHTPDLSKPESCIKRYSRWVQNGRFDFEAYYLLFVSPASGTLTVNQAVTATSVASSKNPSTFGRTVTFTATVASGAGTPTGMVTFKDGATELGTSALSDGIRRVSF